MISGDGCGLNFPNNCLTLQEKSPKKLNQETRLDRGSNPGPLDERQRYYPLTTVVVSCHKILLCLHGSLIHQVFHIPPEMEIKWCQVSWSRGPGYWDYMSNPSAAKGVNQVEIQQALVAWIQVAAGVNRGMPGIFPRVWHDIIRRYTKCIKVAGSHIEHLL